MQRRTPLIPLVSLLFAGACDEAGFADAVDRGVDDPDLVQFRPSGSGTSSGSTRLNTAKLFPEGMPLRHFARAGLPVTYDDPAATQVTFLSVRLVVGGGSVLYTATGNDIRSDTGALRINGVSYTAAQLLGSEWRFRIADATHGPRPFMLRVTGVGIASVPGGIDVPLYNFTAGPSEKFYDDGPDSACATLDTITETNIVLKPVDGTPVGVVNNFKKGFAAVLFGGMKVSELGLVNADPEVIFLGCASGAIGKAGLWGYPPWVSSYGGRTGLQQLQAASRVVRADYCGDGVTHTADGTPLQVRDRFFTAFDDAVEASESVWGSNGSACVVTDDRLVSGAAPVTCGGSLSADCRQLGSDWITGPDQFMWTKLGPATTTLVPKHACDVTGTAGCSDPGVQATVCGMDAYCCATKWDSTCVSEAAGAAGHACCGDTGNPGCGDAAVSACVATYDPYCETARWDSYCALEVESLGCGICH